MCIGCVIRILILVLVYKYFICIIKTEKPQVFVRLTKINKNFVFIKKSYPAKQKQERIVVVYYMGSNEFTPYNEFYNSGSRKFLIKFKGRLISL